MAIQKTEAFILKTIPFRSSSLISTFFTRDFGKIRGLAKGVRDERQNRSASFELFTRLEIVYYEKSRSDLHLISDSFILDTYESLRSRLETIAFASYFCELVDKLCEIHDPHPKIYDLLDFSFRYLASLPGERLSRLFEVKLLNEIGWLPYLDSCLECGNANLEEGFFSARQGALLCTVCKPKYPDSIAMERVALRAVRSYIRQDLEEAIRLPLSAKSDENMKKIMHGFFLERLDAPLKSRRFLDQIQPVLNGDGSGGDRSKYSFS